MSEWYTYAFWTALYLFFAALASTKKGTGFWAFLAGSNFVLMLLTLFGKPE